jgi:hypothetical protein
MPRVRQVRMDSCIDPSNCRSSASIWSRTFNRSARRCRSDHQTASVWTGHVLGGVRALFPVRRFEHRSMPVPRSVLRLQRLAVPKLTKQSSNPGTGQNLEQVSHDTPAHAPDPDLNEYDVRPFFATLRLCAKIDFSFGLSSS